MLVQVERLKGYVTSGVLFIYWLLLLVAGIVPLYMNITDTRHQVRRQGGKAVRWQGGKAARQPDSKLCLVVIVLRPSNI